MMKVFRSAVNFTKCASAFVYLAIAAVGFASTSESTRADAIADFYKGKTLRILIGSTAGGEFDQLARLLARHIGRHIPGNPNVIGVNVPGAAGITMGNQLYATADKDGTTLGIINNNLPMLEAVGATGVRYRMAALDWIGSMAPVTDIIVAWHEKGIKTVNDARKVEVVVGALGRANLTYFFPLLVNDLAGTKFKVVTGYRGGAEINLAMERREIDGRSTPWSSLKITKPEWIRDRKVEFLVQAGRKSTEIELASVPSIDELAKTDEQRAIVNLMTAASRLGRPFAVAPDTPAERVAALRIAFQQTMQDPAFMKEASVGSIELSPIRGEELQAIVESVLRTSKHVTQKAKKYIE